MNQEKVNHFKEKLEGELKLLEGELGHIGKRNPEIKNNVADWEGKPADFDIDTADDTELGDKIEEFEENTALVKNLEVRYNEVKDALRKIKEGKYGLCEIGGELIEEDRLEANPAARTCKKHMQ